MYVCVCVSMCANLHVSGTTSEPYRYRQEKRECPWLPNDNHLFFFVNLQTTFCGVLPIVNINSIPFIRVRMNQGN